MWRKLMSCQRPFHAIHAVANWTEPAQLLQIQETLQKVLHIFLPLMKMLWYKNVREEEHSEVFDKICNIPWI